MSGPLRVLHVHAGNLYGGIETILVTLVRYAALEPRLSHAFALCFDDRLAEELRGAGAPVHALGAVRASRPWTVWRARARLRATLAAGTYDVVIFHSAWSHALLAATIPRTGPTLIHWLHGSVADVTWQQRWAARTPPRLVLCVSAATRATLARLFPHAPATVFYSPVPPPTHLLKDDERRALRAALGTAPSDVVVACAARFDPGKGLTVLLHALSRLERAVPWTCWLAGGGATPSEQAMDASLRTTAAQLGIAESVRFLGHRTDVPQLFAAADVCCLPSTEPEGFPVVLIEALYAGCPIVASACGGTSEIVTDDCGLMVSPGDVAGLAAALGRLASDAPLRRRLASAGPARARQLCDPTRQLAALARLLESAASAVESAPHRSLV